MDIARLGLEVDSGPVRRGTDDLRDFEGQAARTERATGGITKAMRALAPAIAAVTAALSVRALAQYADTWSDLSSRVGLAIRDMDGAGRVMGRLEEIARRSYSSLTTTTEGFLAQATALRELGYSTDESLNYIEAINNALVVSGARGQRATAVMNNLSQAMAQGALRGSNLEYVLTNGGRVTELLAEELGVATRELRGLGREGAITGDLIYSVLTKNLEQLREEAEQMPETIEDGFTLMGNAVLGFVGRVDQAIGASEALAGVLKSMADAISKATEPAIATIQALAENFDRLLYYATAVGTYLAVNWVSGMVTATRVTALLTAGTVAWGNALLFVRTALIRIGIGAALVLVGEMIYQFTRLVDATGSWGGALRALGELASGVWGGIVTAAQAIPPGLNAVWLEIQAQFYLMLQQMQAAWNDFISIFAQPALTVTIGGQTHELIGGLDVSRWQYDLDAAGAAVGRLTERASELRGEAATLASQGLDKVTEAAQRFMGVLSGQADSDLGPDDIAAAWREFNEVTPDTISAINEIREILGEDGLGGSLKAANDNLDQFSAALALVAEPETPFSKLAADMAVLDEALAAGAISWEQYGAAAVRANSAAASSVLGMAGQVVGALGQMFGDNKAFAIAGAVINTAEAITKALAIYGPTPWGFAAAGVAAATGAAQIAAIASANPGSGARAPSVQGGATSSVNPQAQAPAEQRVMNITFAGSGRMSRDDMRQFFEQMEEEWGDGLTINFT